MTPFISGTEARKLVEEHNATLVDVRNPHEFAAGAIPGAINMPLHVFPLRHAELDMSKPIVVYCLSGARSAQAHNFLRTAGFENVSNVGNPQNYMNS
jgi:rhodanese-related sulfurtransferase